MLGRPAGYSFAVVTRGKGRMPSYAAQLTTEERWAVVLYVERLQHTPVRDSVALDDSLRAREIARIDSVAQQERRP